MLVKMLQIVNLQKYLIIPTRNRVLTSKKKTQGAFQLSLEIWLEEKNANYKDLPYFSCKSQLSINIKTHTQSPLDLYSKYQGIIKTSNFAPEVCGKFYTLSEMQSNSYVVRFKREGRKRLH
jgi:hypothetical protein